MKRASLVLLTAAAFLTAGAATATQPPKPVAGPAPRAASPAPTAEDKFAAFVKSYRATALAAGIKPAIYDRAFRGVELNPRVKELNESQPEFVRPIWEYLDGALSERRVSDGLTRIESNKRLLNRLERNYGVDKEILVAIWGLESNFGQNLGSFNVIEALATLAYDGPRTALGREQLIPALRIVQAGEIGAAGFLGSWAGAFGQTQFMPATYERFAVDADGDGRKNLWESKADALGSAANYLAKSGWIAGKPWGREVNLPRGFAFDEADTEIVRTVGYWQSKGVRLTGGGSLLTIPKAEARMEASIVLPAGHRGPAFIALPNFRAILEYNRATSYALAIGLLADEFKGRPGVVASWPRDDAPLSRSERLQLQALLAERGYDAGDRDGVIGRKTRAAIRAFQKAQGLVADGYASQALLEALEKS